jgi:uncharacterized membrane protein YtjA (UPF0391 family)
LCRNRELSNAFLLGPAPEGVRGALIGVFSITEMVMGNLLHYAIVFLIVALVAAAVGFGGVAGFAMEAARLLFWVFIVLFVISLVAGLARRA